MDLASYQALYKDNDAAPGWDAIDRALEWLIAFKLPPTCKANLPVVANPSDHSLHQTYHLNQNFTLQSVR